MAPNRRPWVPRILLLGLIAITAGAAIYGGATGGTSISQSPEPLAFAPVTGFGGYRWSGEVERISAQWRVPTVVNSSTPGSEFTWIGAQSRDGRGPFIQLGSYGYVTRAGGTVSYGLFWSDAAKQFHAVGIVRLKHPGDLIYFGMTKNNSGWRLLVRNQSFGWSRSFEIRYGADGSYDQAEWFQEDPATAVITTTDVPYAATSAVSFEHLLVNGEVPHLRFDHAQALSTAGGTYLVPTHIYNDQFQLVSATGDAKQYLADAEVLDASLYPSAELFLRHAPDSVERAAIAGAAEAYGRFADTVEGQTWPASDRALVSRLVRDNRALQARLKHWVRSNGSTGELSEIYRDTGLRRDAAELRAHLGLPPVE